MKDELKTVDHSHHRQRLNQTVLDLGLENANVYIAMEFILTYVLPRKDVNPVAHRLIDFFGNISAVLDATPEQLRQVKGMGKISSTKLALMKSIFNLYTIDKQKNVKNLKTPGQYISYCKTFLANKPNEELYLICLDKNYKILTTKLLSRGTVNQVTIDATDLMREVVLNPNAHILIFAHSHPNNNCLPSKEDLIAYDRILDILKPFHYEVCDHVIVSGNGCYSMKDKKIYDH